MSIRLHSTLTGRPEPVAPDTDGVIGIYACGPTVYSRIHIGNARPFVVFSVLKRYIERRGQRARLVINVTDVNDKIYDAARAEGIPSTELAERCTRQYIEDTDMLGLGRPDAEPLVTDSMDEIVALIADLVDRGLAYEAGGDVYFRVRGFADYGCLSGRRLDDMPDTDPGDLKHDPLDFALWKGLKEGEDAWWDSPWGPGRPGWHIECSAMAEKELGMGFSVHGGGIDLVFPHHENEIAQSRCAHPDEGFAGYWVHNGYLMSEGEKMSKSLGNVSNLLDLIEAFDPRAYRMVLLQSHYRSPVSISADGLEGAGRALAGLDAFGRRAEVLDAVDPDVEVIDRFRSAMDDDLDTPTAMALVFDTVRRANVALDAGDAASAAPLAAAVSAMLSAVGLRLAVAVEVPDEVLAAAAQLDSARAARDFATADAIRAELQEAGWTVETTRDGTTVRR